MWSAVKSEVAPHEEHQRWAMIAAFARRWCAAPQPRSVVFPRFRAFIRRASQRRHRLAFVRAPQSRQGFRATRRPPRAGVGRRAGRPPWRARPRRRSSRRSGRSSRQPPAPDIDPFATWQEVDAIAEEIDPRFAAIPVFAVGTRLRPEEWIALERRDVDRAAGVVTVERVFTQGRLKPCAKTSRQRRRVPLRQRVVDALDALPPRLDSPLLFPAARGGYIELGKWRRVHWMPALRAAGLEHRRIYDCRHTYATWALAAGVSLFTLSRRMGPRSR
jgi:integrase